MIQFELGILDFISTAFKNPVFDAVLPFLCTLTAHGELWVVLALILLCFKKTRKAGLAIGFALILELLIVNMTIKPLVARPRPYTYKPDIAQTVKQMKDFSFPSGHTAAACSALFALIFSKCKVWIPALVLTVVIMFARMYLYMHFPTDVLAGAVLGAVFGIIGSIIANAIYKKINSKNI